MLIAGDPSGDMLAAELVAALRTEAQARGLAPRFFGAGGAHLAQAGVALAFDLTAHSVIGLSDALRKAFKFHRLMNQLVCLALAHRPDVIICIDFSAFNRQFALGVKSLLHDRFLSIRGWQPKIVQYVSPQVWASRPGRAKVMPRAYDLLLTIFPFEKPWYAERVPGFPVEFVGHPMLDRHSNVERGARNAECGPLEVLLLPGSRASELRRHLPVMIPAVERIARKAPGTRFRMVLPGDSLVALAREVAPVPDAVPIQVGGLAEALRSATISIAATGTVTMECALFGVPTVALYKTSWSTYQFFRRIIQVKYLAMPNLLAGEMVFPEFIQDAATADNLAGAALELLSSPARRREVEARLAAIIANLGGPGAARRAARAVLDLVAAR